VHQMKNQIKKEVFYCKKCDCSPCLLPYSKLWHQNPTVAVNDYTESDNVECLMGSIQSFPVGVMKGCLSLMKF
jgi:hypothetical protein